MKKTRDLVARADFYETGGDGHLLSSCLLCVSRHTEGQTRTKHIAKSGLLFPGPHLISN